MSDKLDPAFLEEIGGMLGQLQAFHKMSVALYEPQVEYIIRNGITDNNQIEHLLDRLIDCAGMCEEGLILFRLLCQYYFPINAEATATYVLSYRDLYDSDEDGEESDESQIKNIRF